MLNRLEQAHEALLKASLDPMCSKGQLASLLAELAGVRLTSLASTQLDAYNQADLDAFCACYADEVQVYRAGEVISEGAEAFRDRYKPLFHGGSFGASVVERQLDPLPNTLTEGGVSVSCVDVEDWWRGPPDARRTGRVWVRYHLRLTLHQALALTEERWGAVLVERVEFYERPLRVMK